MLIPPYQLPFHTLAAQLPELPEGPSLENVRGPIDANGAFQAWQLVLAAVAVLLIAGFLLWLYLRSRKNPPPPINPLTAARGELAAATQAVDDERFALLCANAVRRFMELRYGLPATARTSSEIVASLPLDGAEKERIRVFLDRCDGVKFARRGFSEAQRNEVMETARDLIETMERKEAPEST